MNRIITISREFGSGGRELGKRLAEALHIPCYDHEIIEMIAKENANFTFAGMYDYLKSHGYVIYPGKLTERDTFRLGNIGEIYEEDVKRVLAIFKAYLDEVNHA